MTWLDPDNFRPLLEALQNNIKACPQYSGMKREELLGKCHVAVHNLQTQPIPNDFSASAVTPAINVFVQRTETNRKYNPNNWYNTYTDSHCFAAFQVEDVYLLLAYPYKARSLHAIESAPIQDKDETQVC